MLTASRLLLIAPVIGLACGSPAICEPSPTHWSGMIGPSTQFHCGFGVAPGFQDGYDGLPPFDVMARAGVYMQHYRTNGPSWSGPTGFYDDDRESPIPAGGSHTWWDIRLWAYNTTLPLGDRTEASYTWGAYIPPAGYTGILSIDYVPPSINWTGPWEFVIDLTKSKGFYLPCPITDDPFNPENVTRMHLTVYTYNPVPEPSSLLALVVGLTGVGWRLRRR